MKKPGTCVDLLIAVGLLWLHAGAAKGGPFVVELDGDGIIGNAPDTLFAEVEDQIPVSLWIVGFAPENPGILGFRIAVCTDTAFVDFEEGVYTLGATWGTTPVVAEGACAIFDGVSYYEPEYWQFQVGVATYRAVAPAGIASVIVDTEESEYLDGEAVVGQFAAAYALYVQIASTAAWNSSWGDVKRLFR
jgi:hypothetical protein